MDRKGKKSLIQLKVTLEADVTALKITELYTKLNFNMNFLPISVDFYKITDYLTNVHLKTNETQTQKLW